MGKEKLIKNIKQMASEDALNLEGFTQEVIDYICENNIVNNMYDIFNLKVENFNEENFLKKEIKDLILSIKNCKNKRLDKFIYGSCIPNLTQKESLLIADTFLNFTDLIIDINHNNLDRLKRINGLKKETLESIKENKVYLVNLFVYVTPLDIDKNSASVKQCKIAITGFFNKDRSYYEEKIKDASCIVCNNITSEVNYMLVGDLANPGMMVDAKKCNVKLISEPKLMNLLEEIKSHNQI